MTGLCVMLNVVSKKVILFTKVLDLIFDYFHKKYFNLLWKINELDLIKKYHRSCGGCSKNTSAESENLRKQIIENDKTLATLRAYVTTA
jgi:hypothetical protein